MKNNDKIKESINYIEASAPGGGLAPRRVKQRAIMTPFIEKTASKIDPT